MEWNRGARQQRWNHHPVAGKRGWVGTHRSGPVPSAMVGRSHWILGGRRRTGFEAVPFQATAGGQRQCLTYNFLRLKPGNRCGVSPTGAPPPPPGQRCVVLVEVTGSVAGVPDHVAALPCWTTTTASMEDPPKTENVKLCKVNFEITDCPFSLF